jgi:hypothetical protein
VSLPTARTLESPKYTSSRLREHATPLTAGMATVAPAPMPTMRSSVVQDAPPSPTLTNPDMILPYNPVGASPTPLASSPTLRAADLGLSPGPSTAPTSEPEVGVATAVRMSVPAKARPPSHLLLSYGGYEHGAPLSDIGEEETTPRSKFSRKSRSPSPVEPQSPTPSRPAAKHRRPSNDAASSNGSDIGDWEDFDTSKMMSGRLAADIAKEDDEDIDGVESKRNSALSFALPLDEDRDEMTILNAKAEKILANARQRLGHMEDNLSKARHSMLWSPRSSPNMSELHQPAGGLYRSISLASVSRKSKPLYQPVVKSNLSHSRGLSDTTHTSGGLKRLSMIPEARSSSAQEFGRHSESPQNSQQWRFSPGQRYTAASPASSRSVHSPMRTLEEEEYSSPSTIKTTPENNAPRGLGINTLAKKTQDNLTDSRRSPSPTLVRSTSAASARSLLSQASGLKIRLEDLKAKTRADKERRQSVQSRNTPSPFNHASNPEHWYTSAPEYREGGSPLNTNAGVGWSPVHEKKKSIDAQITPVTPQAARFLDTETPETGNSALKSDARTDVNTPSLHKRIEEIVPVQSNERVDSVIDDSYYEDAAQHFAEDEDQVAASEEEQIYLNEVLEESLQDAEPSMPTIPDQYLEGEVESERHEDRLDAFDYENMFLHSAMGNYTGSGRRSRSDSDSSETSVETRRADQQTPTGKYRDEEQINEEGNSDDSDEEETLIIQHHTEDDADIMPTPRGLAPPAQPWLKHAGRSNSVDSVSTTATFATATEGGDSDSEDEAPHEILHWGNGTAFPAPPVTSPKREMAGAFPTPPTSGRLEQQPSLKLMTGNAFSNGMPTPLQSPMPVSASTKSGLSTPRSQSQEMQSRRQSIGTQRSQTSDGHPGNTEILMESLIKLADPDFKLSGESNVFADVDKNLVLSLLRAVGAVCNDVLKGNDEGEVREVKVLRRRLDEARRVLEGEDEEE